MKKKKSKTSKTAKKAKPSAKTGARAQPLIAVKDVQASSRWYQQVLGAKGLGGGSDHDHMYDRILCNGELILQLHSWDDENHPNMTNPALKPHGHGVVLWFEVDDFEAAVARVRKSGAEVIEEPHFNPAPRHFEIWLRDPNGYVVGLASKGGQDELQKSR